MPRKKRTPRRRRGRAKKTFRRKGRKRMTKRSVGIQKHPTAFADAQLMKFNYSQHINNTEFALNMAAVRGGLFVYRGNTLLNPSYTLSQGQPLWFSTWAGIYYRNLVHGSKISINFIPPGNVASSQLFIAIVPWNQALSQTAISSFTIEQVKSLPFVRFRFTTGQSGGRPIRIHHYMTTNKAFGIRKVKVLTDPDYSSRNSSYPVQIWYWNIFVIPTDEAATPAGSLSVKIKFYAEMYEKIPLKQTVTEIDPTQEPNDPDVPIGEEDPVLPPPP